MYTMNRALQEVAAGYAGNTAFAAGGRAVALPCATGRGNNSLFIIIAIIIAVCACGGLGSNLDCFGRGRRRRGSNGTLLLLFLIILLGGGIFGGGGRNLNTNVINVNTPTDGVDDGGFLDI